jgi:hypothetical protein
MTGGVHEPGWPPPALRNALAGRFGGAPAERVVVPKRAGGPHRGRPKRKQKNPWFSMYLPLTARIPFGTLRKKEIVPMAGSAERSAFGQGFWTKGGRENTKQ